MTYCKYCGADLPLTKELKLMTKQIKIKENIPKLSAENQRLKKQLCREIKNNRKLVKALKEYASIPQTAIFGAGNNLCVLAQEVLKKIGEEE